MLRSLAEGGRSFFTRAGRTWRSAWHTPPTTAVRAINVNLVVVFVFALAALLFLTRTAVSAAQTDDSVRAAINPATSGIAHDTALVHNLDRTVTGTRDIAQIVEPFPGYLSDTATALHSTRSDSASTDSSVSSIERSLRGIDNSVAQLPRSVGRLGNGIRDVRSRTATTSTALSQTAALTGAMNQDIASSNSSLVRVLRALIHINPVLGGIGTDLSSIEVHTRRIADNGVIRLGNVLEDLLDSLLGKS